MLMTTPLHLDFLQTGGPAAVKDSLKVVGVLPLKSNMVQIFS